MGARSRAQGVEAVVPNDVLWGEVAMRVVGERGPQCKIVSRVGFLTGQGVDSSSIVEKGDLVNEVGWGVC